MSKTKKIDKEFALTDSSVNCYGWRLLTEGYLLSEYKKNPIGYAMHKRDDGVVVRWEDFRLDGDVVYAKPVINLSHAMGQRTVDDIENGFVNAASVGHIVVIETSEDASLKLDGQTGPTVTKWYNRECSLVDVPGNFNALIQLFDVDDQPIQNLSDFSKSKFPQTTMNKTVFTGAQLAAMNLKAEATELEIGTAFNDLVAKAAKADALQTQVTGLNTELNNLKAETISAKVTDLIAKGVADGKITVETGASLQADYKTNPEGLKNLLDKMPVYKSVESQLKDDKTKAGEFANLMAKSWDDLFETGEIETLKLKAPDLYKQKYKEAFGKDPK